MNNGQFCNARPYLHDWHAQLQENIGTTVQCNQYNRLRHSSSAQHA